MKMSPIYYAIFYDITKPRTIGHAMVKRIEKIQYQNLIDGLECKTVELKNSLDEVSTYQVISTSTFHIANSIDNHLFVVCDCEMINSNTKQ